MNDIENFNAGIKVPAVTVLSPLVQSIRAKLLNLLFTDLSNSVGKLDEITDCQVKHTID